MPHRQGPPPPGRDSKELNTMQTTDNQQSPLQICIEIARDKFKDYAGDTKHPERIRDQFARQHEEAITLLDLVSDGDSIVINR